MILWVVFKGAIHLDYLFTHPRFISISVLCMFLFSLSNIGTAMKRRILEDVYREAKRETSRSTRKYAGQASALSPVDLFLVDNSSVGNPTCNIACQSECGGGWGGSTQKKEHGT